MEMMLNEWSCSGARQKTFSLVKKLEVKYSLEFRNFAKLFLRCIIWRIITGYTIGTKKINYRKISFGLTRVFKRLVWFSEAHWHFFVIILWDLFLLLTTLQFMIGTPSFSFEKVRQVQILKSFIFMLVGWKQIGFLWFEVFIWGLRFILML